MPEFSCSKIRNKLTGFYKKIQSFINVREASGPWEEKPL